MKNVDVIVVQQVDDVDVDVDVEILVVVIK